jgi:Asp-tRNA(Asn)/Glu-tRNA(Gln) amidotransferase A subunit family amidase
MHSSPREPGHCRVALRQLRRIGPRQLALHQGRVDATGRRHNRSESQIGNRISAADYIDAVQGAERLKDGYAEYFQKYDVLLTPVLPTPSFKHDQAELLINGQTISAMGIMNITSHLNVTGLPAVSMRFGTSKEGMPIGVQIVGSWQAESTILYIASLLEQVSPVSDLHPNL